MAKKGNLEESIIQTWNTSNRITIYLIENLTDELWVKKVPGYERKTIQMIGGHLHNTRCMWIKETGKKAKVEAPESVNRYNVSRVKLTEHFGKSCDAIEAILKYGLEQEGKITGFSPDLVHFLNYLVAHEAHHRGQIIMAARQLGRKLSDEVTYGVWHWSKRAKETSEKSD